MSSSDDVVELARLHALAAPEGQIATPRAFQLRCIVREEAVSVLDRLGLVGPPRGRRDVRSLT